MKISFLELLFGQFFMIKLQEHFPSRELRQGVWLEMTAIVNFDAWREVRVATPAKMWAERRVNEVPGSWEGVECDVWPALLPPSCHQETEHFKYTRVFLPDNRKNRDICLVDGDVSSGMSHCILNTSMKSQNVVFLEVSRLGDYPASVSCRAWGTQPRAANHRAGLDLVTKVTGHQKGNIASHGQPKKTKSLRLNLGKT